MAPPKASPAVCAVMIATQEALSSGSALETGHSAAIGLTCSSHDQLVSALLEPTQLMLFRW
eukprot:1097834-Prymnesium_polylepis.1